MEDVDREVIEKRAWPFKNFLASVFIFIVIVVIFFIITISLNLDLLFLTMVACFFIVIYSIVLFFLLEPRIVREVNTTAVRTVEKPIYHQVVVEKPVQVVHEVEKRIYVTPEPEEPKTIFIKEKSKKLNIPKYEYIGSSQTKTYHKRSCRLSKLIKQKYKVSNNSASYFTRNNYKPCEVCILKTKKV